MSRKYKMHNDKGIYFISYATINWIDVFVRKVYFSILADCLNYCTQNKGLQVFGYCFMPSHVHLIYRDDNKNPSNLLKEIKTFSSKQLRKAIQENIHESRKEWILNMMANAAKDKSNVKYYQFWQQHNKPIEIWSSAVFHQKLDYIHNNPVVSGFVSEPHYWKYSSAGDFAGCKGEVELFGMDWC